MSALSDIAHKQEICREILSTLPELGDDIDTLEALTTALGPLDVFIEFDGDAALGFIALKARSPTAIDIFAIAVRRAAQRRGIGSHLIASAVPCCQDHGAEYLWAALPQQTRSGRAGQTACCVVGPWSCEVVQHESAPLPTSNDALHGQNGQSREEEKHKKAMYVYTGTP